MSGWYILGRTPVRPFDTGRGRPFLFRPGDRVRFEPVGAARFEEIGAMPPDEVLRLISAPGGNRAAA
jgi:allophanate hydrolase subunit 1